MKVPERFIWAADLLEIKSDDHVLEIGCGVGLLIAEVAKKLDDGKIMAVDRSEPMLEKARKRNRVVMELGLVKFYRAAFLEFPEKGAVFDKIVAFNVNFFWHNPEAEMRITKTLLKPGGNLYVFHQSPYEIDKQAAAPISENLLGNGFKIIDIVFKKMHPTSAFCIIASP